MTLADIKNGQKAIVVDIQGGQGLYNKLEALGIHKGVILEKKSSIMSHGPLVIKIGTGEVAMGYNMAKKILVKVG